MATLTVHPDRLLPAEREVRTIARRLYEAVRELPIVSPHGHVDPQILVDDAPFADPASLFIQPDHYVTRLLHTAGVSLDRLGVKEGPLPEERAREVWRQLCGNWHLLRGTPVRYWFDSELSEIFGVRERPSAENADALYDQIAEQLTGAEHRPRALLRRFRIDVMATTDDPADDLAPHARLAADPEVATRVVPTFRPDRYLEPLAPGWAWARGPFPRNRPARCGGSCARTGTSSAAPRCGTGSTASWARSSASGTGRARRTRTPCTTRSPSSSRHRTTGPARCCAGSGSR